MSTKSKNSVVVDEKHAPNDHEHGDKVDTKEVDTAAQLVAGTEIILDKDEANRIRYVHS